jgi:hypothetical protein
MEVTGTKLEVESKLPYKNHFASPKFSLNSVSDQPLRIATAYKNTRSVAKYASKDHQSMTGKFRLV